MACGSPGPHASPGAGHQVGWHLHGWVRGRGPTAACLLQPWLHALYTLPHITPYLSSSDSILPSALFQKGFSPCILDHVTWKKAFTSCRMKKLFSGGVKPRVTGRVGERFIFHRPGLIWVQRNCSERWWLMSEGGRKEIVPHVLHQPLLFPLGSATERLPAGTLHTAFSTLVAPKRFQISLFAGSLGDYNPLSEVWGLLGLSDNHGLL